MQYKKSSWKEKIDPAFDKFIRVYFKALPLMQLPANEGYLTLELDEKSYKKVELNGFQSIASFYEHDKSEDLAVDLGIIFGFKPKMDCLKELQNMCKKKSNFHKAFLLLIDAIDKDSKSYYVESFEPLSSEENFKKYVLLVGEKNLKKFRKKILADIFSIIWHYATLDIEDLNKEAKRDTEPIRKRIMNHLRLVRRNLFFVWDTVSLLVNKKNLKELYCAARKGDEESLFKLIKVDKTLFDHDWVRTRIRKAMYLGDWNFFSSLSRAVKIDPLANRKLYGEAFLVLRLFWEVGLYRLTIPELMQLLKDSGVRIQEDEVIFRKFVAREIKPLFKDLKY